MWISYVLLAAHSECSRYVKTDKAQAFRQGLSKNIQTELFSLLPNWSDIDDIKEKAIIAERKLGGFRANHGKPKSIAGTLHTMQPRDRSNGTCLFCDKKAHLRGECKAYLAAKKKGKEASKNGQG